MPTLPFLRPHYVCVAAYATHDAMYYARTACVYTYHGHVDSWHWIFTVALIVYCTGLPLVVMYSAVAVPHVGYSPTGPSVSPFCSGSEICV